MRTFKNNFSVRTNIALKNKFTMDELYGDIVNEREIEGKPFWVFLEENRPGNKLLAKDAWSITFPKKKLKL